MGTILKLKTWVDASYAIHKNMKSHTGGVVTLDTGAFISKSNKQKLNAKITQKEIVIH